ncbi:hypothetical protein ACFL0M_10670 [Thermodesulfobacteriota bacterium]
MMPKNRKEESWKYYLKNKERIKVYQKSRRIEKKAELKAKRDKNKLEKQVYDFNRNFEQDIITVAEWKDILKSTPNCPGCGRQFYTESNYGTQVKPTLQYDKDEHRVIAVCQICINPYIRGRIGG